MKTYKFWFFVGTQHLYGEEIFDIITQRANEMATYINAHTNKHVNFEFKALLKTSEEIYEAFKEANQEEDLAGVITWMHTFSPSKMWIKGLNTLQKPILHLHTQYNQEIPWNQIDMDFMNLNQAAHGDREHGFIYTKMRKTRKVISGYYKNASVIHRINQWMQSAVGALVTKQVNVVRIGDNMRNVAVTEGDKVDAEITFGWSVNTYGVGDLAALVNKVTESELASKMDEYRARYTFDEKDIDSIHVQAKLEIGLVKLLESKQAKAFTTTFEDLHGLRQLPGLAAQNMMLNGYGFAGEGDWKTAALLRTIKEMTQSESVSASFMEDYTYHLPEGSELVLGAHMLEICPSISAEKPHIQVHPLGIGGKEDPARSVFNAKSGPALQVSIIDLGNRFRMIVTECEAVTPLKPMPNLPVARAMWRLMPNFEVATEAWILSGGAHHTVMTYDLKVDVLSDFAEILGIEFVHIGAHTTITELKHTLLMNELIYANKR